MSSRIERSDRCEIKYLNRRRSRGWLFRANPGWQNSRITLCSTNRGHTGVTELDFGGTQVRNPRARGERQLRRSLESARSAAWRAGGAQDRSRRAFARLARSRSGARFAGTLAVPARARRRRLAARGGQLGVDGGGRWRRGYV